MVKESYIIIRPNMTFDEIKLILLIQCAKYLVSKGLICLPFLSGFCDHNNNNNNNNNNNVIYFSM